jgi:16S rRNA processing protein RimM
MKKATNIHIGHCTSPHGIKGELSFVLYNPEDSVLDKGMVVTLTPRSASSSIPQDGKEFKIKSINFGNKAIATLDQVSDRTTVEAMVPFDIHMDRELLPETEDDEYYVNDLLGLEVFHFYTKELLGRVMDFYENGAQVVLQIKTAQEIIEVIFISQFVPVVEIELNRMEIIPPIMIE